MPPCLDDRYAASRHQTCTRAVCEPLVGFLEYREVPVQHVLFGVGVVDKKKISTPPGQSRAHTRRVELAARRCVPSTRRLGVCGEADAGENLAECVCIDEISHLSTKIHGQIGGVGHHHDLLTGVPADEPRRIIGRNELTFAVSGGHIDANSVLFAPFDGHKLVCEDAVVLPDHIVGVHPLAERDQVVLGSLELGTLGQLFEHPLDLDQLVLVERVYAA